MNRTLRERVMDEADLCRNEGADDIARLLDDVAAALADQAQAEPVAFPTAAEFSDAMKLAVTADWQQGFDCARELSLVRAAPQPAAQPVAVPAGYALVPVEPTREMRKAATIEQEHHLRMSLSLFGDEPAAVIYRAMLSAAPKVQQ